MESQTDTFYFARLTNDTATQTVVTLTRNGAAAQFTRVTFEQSTANGATYTFLGNATPGLPEPQGKHKQLAPAAPQAANYTVQEKELTTKRHKRSNAKKLKER